jgi:recombination protein RecR
MAELTRLPGIGPRSAERIAFHLLRAPHKEAVALADAIRDVKRNLSHCSRCFNLTETDPCSICRDPNRDPSVLVVVEQPKDVMMFEQTGLIRGHYHVLMGHIAPLEGVEPGDLTIEALVKRVRAGGVREVVLATNPTMEGDGTALYIQSLLKPFEVTVSRLARGLAVGSQVEYASRAMLEAAITGRTPL